MDDIYLVLLIVIALLAIIDLSVGVSNDAVNFLNSAVGSKAVSYKTIMIVASVGLVFGALSSSGMMEIAKSGIFNPQYFYFNEIIIIFLTVIIADIFLLDFYNSIGFPTSTTVSIVFELLGAATCIALFKIYAADASFIMVFEYLNVEKTKEIITGIVLSVAIAFTVGSVVQFLSRAIVGFDYHKRSPWITSWFGGSGITLIIYFIVIKGLKGSPLLPDYFSDWLKENSTFFILINFVFWYLLSYAIQQFFRINIFKVVIVLGTFALAMAFAGNDLVNFVGVPIGAYQSYETWSASGIAPDKLTMESLAGDAQAPTYLLMIAGAIMVFTLWTSEKAKRVIQTEVSLSRQNEGKERFKSNVISQNIVRFFIYLNRGYKYVMPKRSLQFVEKRFVKLEEPLVKAIDAPAFDLVRAAVNLMMSSMLIAFATSLKLPLSTTYVTFMVAMGSSLADRAWGSDSAVYRVAGVINVIGGWFLTAVIAFSFSALLAFVIYYFGLESLFVLFAIALVLIIRGYMKRKKAATELIEDELFKKAQSTSIQGIIQESAPNVVTILKRAGKSFSSTLEGLTKFDIKKLKKAKNTTEKLEGDVEELKEHIFYYINKLKGHDVGASRFYLFVQDKFQDISQSLELMAKASLKHVKNNHKELKFNQIRDLKEIEAKLLALFESTIAEFQTGNLNELEKLLAQKQDLLNFVSERIEKQIERTKEPGTSSKNTNLYFTLLLESKDLIIATFDVLELYYGEHQNIKQLR